ncbi:MAG: hypothetical protein KAS93_06580 [Gammaproteobacteria bacterium]|nr:hypothetical protein [Gammaproteobacteria bacterium]
MLKHYLIIFIIICGYSLTAFAANSDLYQVNLIVIKHITAKALASEQWPTITKQPDITNSIEPALLTNDKSPLKTEITRLTRSKNFQIILSASWQQNIPAGTTTKPIHISGGTTVNNDDDSATINEIDGTVTISRNRYFNINTNLILTEPLAKLNQIGAGNYAQTIAKNKLISFQMLQTRRMKSKELNYLDHPLFGTLIEITPVKTSS